MAWIDLFELWLIKLKCVWNKPEYNFHKNAKIKFGMEFFINYKSILMLF